MYKKKKFIDNYQFSFASCNPNSLVHSSLSSSKSDALSTSFLRNRSTPAPIFALHGHASILTSKPLSSSHRLSFKVCASLSLCIVLLPFLYDMDQWYLLKIIDRFERAWDRALLLCCGLICLVFAWRFVFFFSFFLGYWLLIYYCWVFVGFVWFEV